MTAPTTISAFPWRDLDRVERASVPVINDVLQDLTSLLDLQTIHVAQQYLSSVFKKTTSLELLRPPRNRLPHPSYFPNAGLVLLRTLPEHSSHLSALFVLEAGLAHTLVTTTLSSPYLWPNPNRPAPQPVHETCGALLLATGRRLNLVPSFQLHAVGQTAWARFTELYARHPYRVVAIDGLVRVGHQKFGWSCFLYHRDVPTRHDRPLGHAALRDMGHVPLSLPIVGAVSSVSRELLYSLTVGDAWMPGPGWSVSLASDTSTLTGPALLCAPGSDMAIKCILRPDGLVMVGDEVITMQDQYDNTSSNPSESISNATPPVSTSPSAQAVAPTPGTAQVLADAPLLLRVELGTVSLTAEQWAQVSPGTVLTTGHPVGQQVILRAGELEIGRGELVNIEGELGVRVQSLTNNRGKSL